VTVGALALMTVFPVARAAVENTTQRPGQERAAQMQERREQRMKQLDEKLKLTAEQKTKIAAIWGKAAEEEGAMRIDAELKRRGVVRRRASDGCRCRRRMGFEKSGRGRRVRRG